MVHVKTQLVESRRQDRGNRGQRTEVRGKRREEIGGQKSDGRSQMAEDR